VKTDWRKRIPVTNIQTLAERFSYSCMHTNASLSLLSCSLIVCNNGNPHNQRAVLRRTRVCSSS